MGGDKTKVGKNIICHRKVGINGIQGELQVPGRTLPFIFHPSLSSQIWTEAIQSCFTVEKATEFVSHSHTFLVAVH